MKKKNRAAQRGNQNAALGFDHLFLSAIRAVLAAAAMGALLLLGVTAIAFAQDDPEPLVRPLGYAASVLTVLTAGFLTVRFHGRRCLLCGLFSAALLLLIFAALSLIPAFSTTAALPIALSIGMHAAVVLFSVLGAYLGLRRRRR